MTVSKDQIVELLKASTEFGLLPDHILGEFAGYLEIQDVDSGVRIISEGEQTNSMFVLISGRLRVSRQGGNGDILLYNEILPGECVGELGMILYQDRTADITSIRKSTLGILTQEKFEALIKKYPLELNRTFSQAIYNHLRHRIRITEQKIAQAFVLIPLTEEIDIHKVSRNLTEAFSLLGSAEHLIMDSSSTLEKIQINALETNNNFIVYQAEAKLSKRTIESYQNADQILFIAKSGTSKQLSGIEKQLAGQPGFELMRKHLIVLHENKTNFCDDKLEWQKERDVERVYPACMNDLSDYRRIARFLIGRAVGVVLGGGGAKGFAHLGVLRAFEEANIPIDLLGGNSMGALIGACYAFGIPLKEIHHEILRYIKGAVRLDLPIVSILSGENFEKSIKETFGNTLIQTLWLSYFAGACNLSKANTFVLDSGMLRKAVLASNSPAGLLPPVIHMGELLVDGSILENVPVPTMRIRLGTKLERRRGNGTIIAIDVDVKENFTVDKNITALKKWNVIKSSFDSNADKLPGIKNILLHSSLIGGLAQRGRIISAADYYLEPPVSQFPITGYKDAEKIIAIGYQYTVEKIADWKLF